MDQMEDGDSLRLTILADWSLHPCLSTPIRREIESIDRSMLSKSSANRRYWAPHNECGCASNCFYLHVVFASVLFYFPKLLSFYPVDGFVYTYIYIYIYLYTHIYTCYQCHAIISLLSMSLVKLSLSCHAIMLSMSLSCYHANAINAINGMLSLLSMSLVLGQLVPLRCGLFFLVAALGCGCRSVASVTLGLLYVVFLLW